MKLNNKEKPENLVKKVGSGLSKINGTNIAVGGLVTVMIGGLATLMGFGIHASIEECRYIKKNTFTSTGIVQKINANCNDYKISLRATTPDKGKVIISKNFNYTEECTHFDLKLDKGSKIRFTGYPKKSDPTIIKAESLEILE